MIDQILLDNNLKYWYTFDSHAEYLNWSHYMTRIGATPNDILTQFNYLMNETRRNVT